MYFVRAIGKAQGTCLRVRIRHAEIIRHTATAMRLYRPVDHLTSHIRCSNFNHRDFFCGRFIANGIHHLRGIQNEETRLIDQDTRIRNPFQRDALLCDPLTKSNPAQRTFAHVFQRALCKADQAHAVMYAARAKTPLRDFKTAAFT